MPNNIHEHELRIEEHVNSQMHSFADALRSIDVEVRIRRLYAPLPQSPRLGEGLFLSDVESMTTGSATLPIEQALVVKVTITEEEQAAYLALRERIIGRVLAALEVRRED